ncbi:unnamed protein product [Spirodela intermedia]|uniref:PHD finger protein ALFIN-LIKE n=1 Tax=Spirodela intermedia TaxID=51605 RepID=A0A7I8J2N9_SPIIN|nr:unnamed protein product [Spirodela intermedia]CAA6664242.1 unnamed protein product [Spirodela intermedia]
MDGSAPYNPRTVEEVYRDFKGRRAGIIKALTSEMEDFYQQCDPALEVNLPAEEVPAELPEPALGINFARDGMQEKDWISLVAVHSDAWLLAVAFYFGARFGFDRNDRKRLFNMINDLPPFLKPSTGRSCSGAAKGGVGRGGVEEEEEEEEGEHGETLCGACGESYASDEFWICCDICERWFHGKCVKITPARAEHIKQYKCPSCSKRARPS